VNRVPPLSIGVVSYLNSRPLAYGLDCLAPQTRLLIDVPSRLADALAGGALDVALIPSIEYLRQPGCVIVGDACVACEGPVRSVKLYSRVPPRQIRTLALDEGSRTSAALAQILLREQWGVRPRLEPFPIGATLDDLSADAAVVIGDRGMQPVAERFDTVWDLGQQWNAWTGLPFVFAMWVGRAGIDEAGVGALLAAARDAGVAHLDEIARQAATDVQLPAEECLSYLRDNLAYHLGPRQRRGLQLFYDLARRHGLAPAGGAFVVADRHAAG